MALAVARFLVAWRDPRLDLALATTHDLVAALLGARVHGLHDEGGVFVRAAYVTLDSASVRPDLVGVGIWLIFLHGSRAAEARGLRALTTEVGLAFGLGLAAGGAVSLPGLDPNLGLLAVVLASLVLGGPRWLVGYAGRTVGFRWRLRHVSGALRSRLLRVLVTYRRCTLGAVSSVERRRIDRQLRLVADALRAHVESANPETRDRLWRAAGLFAEGVDALGAQNASQPRGSAANW